MIVLENFADFERYLTSFTNYERQRTFTYGLETLRLSRMRELVADLGDPQNRYPSVHIAGTKGKGSTSLILEALLAAEGFRVGTYTSPHVEHLRERIRVDGRWISEDDAVRTANRLLATLQKRPAAAGADRSPTFFELMTALAMSHFASEGVDWAIFEVGLGGRLDATNVLSPRMAAITSIGLEHVQLLGDSVEKIAREKAGIIKERVPVVAGEMPDGALREIVSSAGRRNAELILSSAFRVEPDRPGHVRIEGFPYPLPAPAIRGPALRRNLSVALLLHRLALEATDRAPSRESIGRALAEVALPARVELFEGSPPVILDGAHTADSFANLRDTLEEIDFPRPRTVVFSLASDKWAEPILEGLPELGEEILLTRADLVRSIAPGKLRDDLERGEVIEEPRRAMEEALRRGRPVVVCGSMYLAGEVRGMLR